MKLAVIGSGIMGRGIAQVCITSGYETILVDIDDDALDKARTEIEQRLHREVEKQRMSQNEAASAFELLEFSSSITSAVWETSFVIECVPENLELKQSILSMIEKTKPQIIATNTSSISIDRLSEGLEDPSVLIGMHFFNPAPVMKLVEIVIGTRTSDDVIEKTQQLALQFKKEPIMVKDFPGFASSRLGVSLGLEAIRMVEQGVATPSDIDKAMTFGYRHPMGPLELTDYIGLDTRLKIAEYLNSTGISPSFDIPDLLKEMVNEGKLGRKTGEGFYKWEGGKRQ